MTSNSTVDDQIPKDLLTPTQVAKKLNVSLGLLATWRHRQKGPPWIRFESLIRYPAQDLQVWFAAQNATKKPGSRCNENRT